MDFAVRQLRRGCVLAAFFMLAALAPSGALRAEPATASALDAKAFNWPQPSSTLDRLDTDRFRRTAPESKPRDQLDLGGSQLRLDTSRTPVDLVPHALDDASDLGDVVVAKHRGHKHSRWRQYFGLTLTTPTN